MSQPQSQLAKQTEIQNREQIVEHLQRQMANAFVLYTNYKRYHWLVYGPLFHQLHLLFDEHAREILGTIDEFGERIRMIGDDPISLPEFTEVTTMKIAEGRQTPKQMIEQAIENHRIIIREMRDAARLADDSDDPGSNDLFSSVVRIHEKQEWFLRDLIEEEDELIT